jgi:hypothetical protein
VFRALALALLAVVPAPRVAAPGAAPQILYTHLSSQRIHVGDRWSGRIVTTTNVASVVVSAPFFSFVVPRTAFGEFAFSTHVLAVPALYRQRLYGSIIAYNAAGESVSVPLEMDFR